MSLGEPKKNQVGGGTLHGTVADGEGGNVGKIHIVKDAEEKKTRGTYKRRERRTEGNSRADKKVIGMKRTRDDLMEIDQKEDKMKRVKSLPTSEGADAVNVTGTNSEEKLKEKAGEKEVAGNAATNIDAGLSGQLRKQQ